MSKKSETLKIIQIEEGLSVKKLAEIFKKEPSEIIKKLMSLGEMATINQPVSLEGITLLAEELGLKAKIVPALEAQEPRDKKRKLKLRPPVVTIMGHVDHGKTLLLDAIRKSDVVSQEVGGITQHIGAYQVAHQRKKITFLDTPGHEAFTAMRAHGAKVTDIAVLVVAADDGVMPQTIEAIDHARAAKVPILVAINKIDKPQANPEKVKKDLASVDLIPEEWGGKTVFVSVSAKEKKGLEELLEMILLVAEIQELKARVSGSAKGVVIEAKLDKGRGPVATVLIKEGELKVGETLLTGHAFGKVKAMIDDKGNPLPSASPSQPVEVLGFSAVPKPGDEIKVVSDEKKAREIAEERALKKRLLERGTRPHISLDNLGKIIKEGEAQELNLILKADVQGSLEALKEALAKLDQKRVKLNFIHLGVGAVSETDVMLAAASEAIVIGFNVRPVPKVKEMALREGVDLRLYNVIYKVIEDIEKAQTGLLKPIIEEEELGRVEVRATFKMPKVGVVAGGYVSQGQIKRGSWARLVREGKVVYEGKVVSLKRFKEDTEEVEEGLECGIGLSQFQDIKVGDVIEVFEKVEKLPT